MKKFWITNRFVLISFSIWLAILYLVERFSILMPTRPGYFGPIPWANFDGVHYLRIAETGYVQYLEAFFPFYPLAIRFLHQMTTIPQPAVGVGISLFCFLIGLLVLYTMLFKRSKTIAMWTILFLLAFPTSFFFRSVYTEGVFFLFFVLTMYWTERKQFIWAGIAVGLAGATKIVGLSLAVYVLMEYIRTRGKNIKVQDVIGFICMPLGLIAYMLYLWRQYNDPFLFFHVQSAFGANRSGSKIILLPQVVWRYLKIMFTAYLQPTVASYLVTIFEFISMGLGYLLVWIGRKTISVPLLLYSVIVLTIPTFTGTFSSMPRYILSAVPLFIVLGSIRSKVVRIVLLLVSFVLEIMATTLFLRGWFIA